MPCPWQLALGEHVKLVGAEYPGLAAFAHRTLAPGLNLRENHPGGVAIHLLPGIQVRELGKADWNHRGRKDSVAHVPQIAQRFLQHSLVVQSWNDHHLAVKLYSAGGETRELRLDVRDALVVEQNLPGLVVRGVNRDVQ